MRKITVYEPICSSENGKCWFSVNGATDEDRDSAIRKAMRHVGVKDGAGKIERIDEHEVWDVEFYNKSY